MSPIVLTTEQYKKVMEMSVVLVEDVYGMGSCGGQPTVRFLANDHFVDIHWFEFCLQTLIPAVAALHGNQPYTTPDWSIHMVRQKIINDLPTVNPIDTLYDIWKHPEKYAQEL